MKIALLFILLGTLMALSHAGRKHPQGTSGKLS
jgi:hypothetical protein